MATATFRQSCLYIKDHQKGICRHRSLPSRARPVCRKCFKRVPGGSRIKRALKSAAKSLRDARPGRRPRRVMTGCFGICPKRAVVVACGTTLHRGEYILLADADQVVDAVSLLMPADRP